MTDELGEVVQYYERTDEEDRLATGIDQLELLRTQEILNRCLTAAPAKLIDVGGEAARAIESEPSLLGLSAHLLLIAHAPHTR